MSLLNLLYVLIKLTFQCGKLCAIESDIFCQSNKFSAKIKTCNLVLLV